LRLLSLLCEERSRSLKLYQDSIEKKVHVPLIDLHYLLKRRIMKLIPLDGLGAREVPGHKMRFGILLPWVAAVNGNRLFVKLIHEADQFLQEIQPKRFSLQHATVEYGDYWSGEIGINETDRDLPTSAWGTPGRYIYRYELESPLLAEPLDWIVDPFAREFGVGRQSAFTLGYQEHVWGPVELTWKTPALQDLVVYEIMLNEFSVDLDGAFDKLPYLRDLGINCLEIMPVANVDRSVDWGFETIGPFGLDERFGQRRNLQQFVQAAHEHGIAVMLDMIYGHAGAHFAYEYVYTALGYDENPFMGPFSKDMFGPSTDYRRAFTRDFYFTVNHYWLDRYHVDGIRYDCVPNYYDGVDGLGYTNLVYHTYQKVKETNGTGYWQRFFHDSRIHLIQCAEQLEAPVEAVAKTYSNCTWQNETLNAAIATVGERFGSLYNLGMRLGLLGYPETVTYSNGDSMVKSALQYLENHDHPRFICRFGEDYLYKDILKEGKTANWYKLQPYVIGLLLAKGIPMLWQGQEIVENYDVPDTGPARIGTLRPVRWEKFYTDAGQGMIRLFRKLIALRNKETVFRRGAYRFINNWAEHQSKGLLVFERELENSFALVALNFSGRDQSFNYQFLRNGDYQERLHGEVNFAGVGAGDVRSLTVPSNYGRVWVALE
jgi:maltooligosyltrehalose trehalohydrolase